MHGTCQEVLDIEPAADSIAELRKQHTILAEAPLEFGNLTRAVTSQGRRFVWSPRDQVVGQYTHLGGFGSGQYVPADPSVHGLRHEFAQGDSTAIQVVMDEGKPAEMLTLYQVLAELEQQHTLDVKVSFTDITREAVLPFFPFYALFGATHAMQSLMLGGGWIISLMFKLPMVHCASCQVKDGKDSFKVAAKKDMIYKFVQPPSDPPPPEGVAAAAGKPTELTAKTIFKVKHETLASSRGLLLVFRYRYLSAGKVLKVQKPYVVAKQAWKLKALKPVEARRTTDFQWVHHDLICDEMFAAAA